MPGYGRPQDPLSPGNPSLLLHHLMGDLSEEDLLRYEQMLGIEPPQMQAVPGPPPEETGGQRFLQAFQGAEAIPMQQPRGFGQGLVAGLTRGLGAAGTRSAGQRAKLVADV